MFKSIRFQNFKALRNATLPLGTFTLVVGPNGSGKTTALQGFDVLRNPASYDFSVLASAAVPQNTAVEVMATWGPPADGVWLTVQYMARGSGGSWGSEQGSQPDVSVVAPLGQELARVRIYSLDPAAMVAPVNLFPQLELGQCGEALAGVLDRLRDQAPERFEALNDELGRLLPEFDRILFETPSQGKRAFQLRTRQGGHAVSASDVSQGTVLALAILTLAYLPEPPSVVGLEEPDRGIHPRLLRELRDALYRLSYPESAGEKRPAVQVIATTHSPYFLDLFKDHPEEIVIAEKIGLDASFHRLVDRPDIDEILGDAALGDIWYSGVLGGVPAKL